MTIVSVGIDLAKDVFAVHGVDEAGKRALVRPNVPRAQLLELIALLGHADVSTTMIDTHVGQVAGGVQSPLDALPALPPQAKPLPSDALDAMLLAP